MKKILFIFLIAVNLLFIGYIFTEFGSLLFFLFIIFTMSLLILSYKSYALKNEWKIGRLFIDELSPIKIASISSLLFVLIAAFFITEWYYVLFAVIYSWLLSGATLAIFRDKTQILALSIFSISILIEIVLAIVNSVF